jgi:hypothetical protein
MASFDFAYPDGASPSDSVYYLQNLSGLLNISQTFLNFKVLRWQLLF